MSVAAQSAAFMAQTAPAMGRVVTAEMILHNFERSIAQRPQAPYIASAPLVMEQLCLRLARSKGQHVSTHERITPQFLGLDSSMSEAKLLRAS